MPQQSGHKDAPGQAPIAARIVYLAIGWLCVGLAVAGAVMPVLPTTVFLIIALWAFTRGSERYRHWLYTHPRFGPSLVMWNEHRVIPVRAKVLACVMMVISFSLVLFMSSARPWLPIVIAAIMVAAASYVISCPSRIPAESPPDQADQANTGP